MPNQELTDIEVDPGRITYGIRRFWWFIVVGAVLGLSAGVVLTADQTTVESEFRISDNRHRLEDILLLNKIESTKLIMETTEFRDAVKNAADGRTIAYTVDRTPTGNFGISVVAESEDQASADADIVLQVLNDWMKDEQLLVAEARIPEIESTIEALGAELEGLRSEGSDNNAELIERLGFLNNLAREKADLVNLSSLLNSGSSSIIEVRRSSAVTSARTDVLIRVVAGALIGLGAAALLGVLLRRLGRPEDLKRLVGDTTVFEIGPDSSTDEITTIAAGLLHLTGHDVRMTNSIDAIGTTAQEVRSRLITAGGTNGLDLTIAGDEHSTGDQTSVVLVGLNSPIREILTLRSGTPVVLIASAGDTVDDVAAQVEQFGVAGVVLRACVMCV